MPIREFQCSECQNTFEKLNPPADVECPNCGSKNVRQKFSTCSWVFRGAFELFNEEEKVNDLPC